MRWNAASSDHPRRAEWAPLVAALLCFALVAYFGMEGGGFDPLVHDPVGIAIWWVAVAGLIAARLPRGRLSAPEWTALGLLGAFAAWTTLSLIWTESAEATTADLARILLYLGVFALAILVRIGADVARVVGAVAAAIAAVCVVALLSRLHPAWFSEANETALILNDPERLSYPLDYWNALGAFVAIGLPLLLQVAAGARAAAVRGLAAAAMPALVMTAIFTLSRGGIAAAVFGLFVFFLLASDRLPKLLALLPVGIGSAVLIAASLSRDALREGLLGPVARQQGDELLLIVIVVCCLVGLTQALGSHLLLQRPRPAWSVISSRTAVALAVGGAVVVLAGAVAADVPARVSSGWDEFKQGGEPGTGTERLGSVAGQSRYQLWKAALKENETAPLVGTGAATFRFWWARNGTTGESVVDTHSLYLQTLGELGIVGFLLLVAFLLAVFGYGARNALRAPPARRAAIAAAVAGCAAFCLAAGVDWMWQVPALSVAMLVLAAAALGAWQEDRSGVPIPTALRFALLPVAVAAIVAIAIPLSATSLVRQSEAAARDGELTTALREARSAQNVEPGAASPRLQQALVLERMGALTAAAAVARAATERESTNWRPWLVLFRIEAERGRSDAALSDYRRARSLNPRSPLFERK